MMTAILRQAQQNDADALTRLAKKGKAHWPYPTHWLAAWDEALTLRPEQIAANYFVLERQVDVGSEIIAFTGLETFEGRWYIEHCWVDPAYHGGGHGKRLVQHALMVATSMGLKVVWVESDPNAQAFYEKLGAVLDHWADRPVCGEARQLPVLRFQL
ncbi:GNAT family N-acetyltransferase [Leeia aquatica]|uniref:GNAT family N-acetyltransferase n=1 Tax=Leeia aquatica TaxID=2725557 RepID=A0A847SGT6_9NEIS|nr:GNAT family N-acetyltransferase [Leeia aquatica]NLR76478.1 GNAT family N-acetyltransferase [Leeia aquatica]